ncbi:MAG: hypothetical protein JXM73_02180 [Anaerolineae bacterium]|nr:hypothetical protein [Anaerolineae bacterium]
MDKREAKQCEQSLQQASRGEAVDSQLDPVVQTARQVMILSETPPPPPHGLAPGRQRFLAEAARLRAGRAPRRPLLVGAMRLATALAVIAILFGVVMGTAQAAAGSLPGQPLYGVKLATEQIRLALTSQPASRAALEQALAEERLDEIVALLNRKQTIDAAVSSRAVRQLEQALARSAQLEDAAAAQALQRLAEAIRQREQAMLGAAGESPEPPVRQILREMERVRQEAHAGQGDPAGLRHRLRQGTPAEPTGQPAATHTPQTPSPSGTPEPAHTPQRMGTPNDSPGPSGTPGQTPGSGATSVPTGGPHASRTPEPSATLQTTEPPYAPRTPGPNGTPGPTGGPSGTPELGQTPGQGEGSGNKP